MSHCITKTTWKRVSKRHPCPICGKTDWCVDTGPEDSPEAVICARNESPKKCGEAGWLHILRRDGPTWSPRVRKIEVSARRIGEQITDFGKLAEQFRAAVRPAALERLASSLGLSVEGLQLLGVGWSAKNQAWAFPMKDAHDEVVGIRLRLAGGKKIAVRGGKEGLFIPQGLVDVTQSALLICEGPTDTTALNDLGFNAIGRPSCSGGTRHITNLVSKWRPPCAVIVADGDAPGQRGAESLAAVLLAYSAAVRIISPPAGVKDARAWVQAGATAADVMQLIDAAPVRKLSIRVQGGRHGR